MNRYVIPQSIKERVLRRQGKLFSHDTIDAGSTALVVIDMQNYFVAFTLALARRWPDVLSNAVDPGWVRTKMGGASAPVALETGARTQSWLAVSAEQEAKVSGRYWHQQHEQMPAGEAADPDFQNRLIGRLAELTGETLPEA